MIKIYYQQSLLLFHFQTVNVMLSSQKYTTPRKLCSLFCYTWTMQHIRNHWKFCRDPICLHMGVFVISHFRLAPNMVIVTENKNAPQMRPAEQLMHFKICS